MNVAAAIALLNEVIVNGPQYVKTGQQVIELVVDGAKRLQDAIGNRTDVTPEEINELVSKIIENSGKIQAIK